jgi:glycosyltransferase involved in cell wall biosynthesis
VLSVGGVEPRKNSLRALEAMATVLRRHAHVRWLIVGGASIWEHDAYRSLFRERLAGLEPQLGSRITELGPVTETELTALYGISQILLCPSLQEGFGLCVLEAMAASTAVVVSDAEPFTEYLPANAASWVEAESAACIAGGVERLLVDSKLRQRLASDGVERAAVFSWDRVAAAHERFYESALSQPHRSPPRAAEDQAHA